MVALCVILVYIYDSKDTPAEREHNAAQADTTSATISAVGDITISDAILADLRQPDGSDSFAPCFLNVAPLLHEADLTVGNLELTLAGEPYGGTTYSAPDSLAKTLDGLGFDILQTANSKAVAAGIAGLRATLDTLRANGLEPLGTYGTLGARNESGSVILREINGIRFAFFAFTKGLDGMAVPEGAEYCTNLLYEDYTTSYSKIDKTKIQSVIDEAKALNPDVIIAMVHWGSEYKMAVSQSQKDVADLMFQNGVDVILGSHSHMVGPMETKEITMADGTKKSVFVAYSLGNFLGSSKELYTQDSLILNLEFTKNDFTGDTTMTACDYKPIYIADYGEDATDRFQVLDIETALSLYDSSYLGKVSESTRDKMLEAVSNLRTNTQPPVEEEKTEESEE